MENQLVSFGNYLLKKCKVRGYDVDGEPCFEREVTDADILNWRDQYQGKPETPSQHQVGDKVKVFLMPEGEESFPGFSANVLAVHFYNEKVKYDLEMKFYGDWSSRIYNVDSILISKN